MKIKYLLLSLLTPLFLIGNSNAYISQQHISEYNLESVGVANANVNQDLFPSSGPFTFINTGNDTYCFTINTGLHIVSSTSPYNLFACINGNCASAGVRANMINSNRYFGNISNITKAASSFTIKNTATITDIYNFQQDNFICFTPYYGYSNGIDGGLFNTFYASSISLSAYPNIEFGIYKVKSSSSSSCDYSEYESTINTLSGNLATCNVNLNNCLNSNCDTQLSQCIIDRDNALDTITTLSGSLASCNSDKASLQNYNDSLSSQLNQCLESVISGENASGLYLTYNLFWQDNDSMFSLPITNNLFLPNGYKGKLDDDNVLSIAKLNNLEAAYMFSDDDKVNIIDLLSMVMLFLLATGSLIGLIVFLKRLVIKK